MKLHTKKLLLAGWIIATAIASLGQTQAADLSVYGDVIANTTLVERIDAVAMKVAKQNTTVQTNILNKVSGLHAKYKTNAKVMAVLNYLTTAIQNETTMYGEENIVETAIATEMFPTLVAAVQAAELGETLSSEGPFTVFALTEEAFKKLLTDLDMTAEELLANKEVLTKVLMYHVVAWDIRAHDVMMLNNKTMVKTAGEEELTITTDGKVMIDNANLVTTDIVTENGIIHVIDTVLVPMSVKEMLWIETMNDMTDIVETAVSSELFPTLVTAIKTAELTETLMEEGPFTVFAPTEEAFAKLLTEKNMTIDQLLADKEMLKDVLLYHVVPGTYMVSDIMALTADTKFKTAQWTDVVVKVWDTVMVNNSTVTKTDIKASNGVIHVIDTVLMPTK